VKGRLRETYLGHIWRYEEETVIFFRTEFVSAKYGVCCAVCVVKSTAHVSSWSV